MFGRLFGGTSSTQVNADITASRSFADEGHGTIATAPNAHDLLRSSKQQPAGSRSPQLPAEHRDAAHTEQHATQQDSAQAPPVSTSRQPTAVAQPSGQAAKPNTLEELQRIQPQPAAGGNYTASPFALQQLPVAGTGETALPALCQVASSSDYAQNQRQPDSRLQQNHLQMQQQTLQQTKQQVEQQVPGQLQPLVAANNSHQQSWSPQPPVTSSTLLQQQQSPDTVEALQQKLLLEAKAREELEDMLLRYERHLKAETAARQEAEQQMAAALAHAANVRQQLVSNGRQAKQQDDQLAAEHAAMQQERAELEQMRNEFEAQLHTARNELNKAQAAMSSNEDRVRAAKAEERAQITAEYEMRLAAMMAEVERLREELATRTQLMSAEMGRWKQQAAVNAAAVADPITEVLNRRRELNSTKDRMDQLMAKLYAGRESNVLLPEALAAAVKNQQVLQQAYADQLMLQQANTMASHVGGRSLGGPAATTAAALFPQAGLTGRPAGFFADDTPAYLGSTAGYNAGHDLHNAYTAANSKVLVPTMQRAKAGQAAGAPGYSAQPKSKFPPPPLQLISHAGVVQQPPQQQQHRSAPSGVPGRPPHLQQLPLSPRSSSRIPQLFNAAADTAAASPTSTQYLPAGTSRSAPHQRNRSTSRSTGRNEGGSYAHLHQQHMSTTGSLSPRGASGYDAFGHVVSRYAQSAAKYSKVQQAKAKKQQKVQGKKQQLPDRFAESAKSAAMISAMASRFG